MIKLYTGRRRDELGPHVFAVADESYRNLLADRESQSMLVTYFYILINFICPSPPIYPVFPSSRESRCFFSCCPPSPLPFPAPPSLLALPLVILCLF